MKLIPGKNNPSMIVFPNAKINLGLRITSKRPDGYHNLDTVFYPINLKDALEIITDPDPLANDVTFTSSGLSIPGSVSTNLCIKAYQLLKTKFPELPAIHMHLHKNIPMGAGLGGGSADGAFTLQLLNKKYKLNLGEEELIDMALALGSDCPFFIKNTPVHATSRGEIMQSTFVDLSDKKIVLILPDIHVSTALAFKDCPISSAIQTCDIITQQPVDAWKELLINDFEQTVFPNYPALANIKAQLYDAGAVYASMTGTGSTIFGIFNNAPELNHIFSSEYQVVYC
jgi:4-diphosphocytidyl-2-C-methyl-D-erythritol kinase